MIKKILVANRGEIAVRVMRSCREMEITSIAIFSEADRTAKHVLYADEAYCVGPAASKESYLNIEKIIEVAKELMRTPSIRVTASCPRMLPSPVDVRKKESSLSDLIRKQWKPWGIKLLPVSK